jgi:hypothetical protein
MLIGEKMGSRNLFVLIGIGPLARGVIGAWGALKERKPKKGSPSLSFRCVSISSVINVVNQES